MNRLSPQFVFIIFLGLAQSVLNAQSAPTPQEVASQFCEVHNTGEFLALLPMLSPKTKATLMMSHMVATGVAPISQQERFKTFDQKWSPRIEAFIESESIDVASASPWKAINSFSNWSSLDEYLAELTTLERRPRFGPTYRIATEIVPDGDHAKGSIQLITNGGILAGLNGNSINNIDVGTIDIFLINLSDKWLVCHENEYNGELNLPTAITDK